ncbi:MAG: PilZ domain-containing protein, partial [bacterium]
SEELPDQMPGTFRLKVDPAGVRKVNRRLFPRFSFAPPIAATATPEGWERPVAGRLINLSAGGLRIETDEPLPADCAIAFRFDVESDDEIHSIARIGSIVYEVPMQSGFAYGVRFGRDEEDTISGEVEASVESLDKTADLLNLVNRLLVRR